MAMYDAGASKMTAVKQGNGQPEGEMDALLLGITKELVASSPSQRNYKGILIALLVICAVLGLILLAIYLLRPPDDGPRVKGRKVTIEDLSSNRFQVKAFNGSWISGNEILYQDHLDRISIFNAETLESRSLVTSAAFGKFLPVKFSLSANQKFILYTHGVEPTGEYSYLANYTAFDIDEKQDIALSPSDLNDMKDVQGSFQYMEWGTQDQKLIFIHGNNIYFKPSPRSSKTFQLTHTGQLGIIFNGLPDWLYETEILKSPKAFWMSPNGKMLVFALFNDSMVGEATFPWYANDSPYPELRTIRYPKAGTANPEVTLWVVHLDSLEATKDVRPQRIHLPSGVNSRDHYLTSLAWIDDEDISVVWVNRNQNTVTFATCRSSTWECNAIYVLKPPGLGWLDFPPNPTFSSDKSSCLLRIPWRDGDAGYFHHIVWLDVKNGKEIPVTSGSFEVTEILTWDQINEDIYFIAVPPSQPGERHLNRVSQKSSNSSTIVPPICLTCPKIKPQPKPNQNPSVSDLKTELPIDNIDLSDLCLYNKVTFSPSNLFYIRECLGPGVPTVSLHQTTSGQQLLTLINNFELKTEVSTSAFPQFKTIPVMTSSGFIARVKLYLPPGFRDDEDFKFPLVLHVNGAPGSQLVSEKWKISWTTYLTSQKNFIVAEIDGRGSGFQGENIRQSIHKNLGDLEVVDQLEVLQYFRDDKNYSYIDEENMAIWGWGYGGTLTLLALAKDTTKLFKCGIAVAPITKWEFYDSIYAERFLGMPNYTENFEGYEEGDLVGIVKALEGKKFLLIHGTADERVHYQHTLHLAKELIKNGVSFTEQIYPDQGHDLSGVTDHLYNTMDGFLDSCFEKPNWDDWERANFLGIPI